MSDVKPEAGAPWHLWVIGVLLLLFTGMGAFDYVATVARFEPYLSQFPEEVLAHFYSAPLWMYGMWGISSIGGLISVILLLMRRKAAIQVYAVALVCSVVAVIYGMMNPAPGSEGAEMFGVIVIAIAVLILLYMVWLRKRGVLR